LTSPRRGRRKFHDHRFTKTKSPVVTTPDQSVVPAGKSTPQIANQHRPRHSLRLGIPLLHRRRPAAKKLRQPPAGVLHFLRGSRARFFQENRPVPAQTLPRIKDERAVTTIPRPQQLKNQRPSWLSSVMIISSFARRRKYNSSMDAFSRKRLASSRAAASGMQMTPPKKTGVPVTNRWERKKIVTAVKTIARPATATNFFAHLTADEVRQYRGTLTEAGRESPYRNRPLEENLDLFERMRAGEFPDGSRTLPGQDRYGVAQHESARSGDVSHPARGASSHRQPLVHFPMYDLRTAVDSIEGVTHSICTLEFEDHRPLYDWYLEQLGIYRPHQYEFDRLNLTYTLLSKRKLLQLVKDGHVRAGTIRALPTLSGIRRRGYTPEAIRNFCHAIGVSKTNGTIELGLLEHHVREDLNKRAPRMMARAASAARGDRQLPGKPGREMEAVNNPE